MNNSSSQNLLRLPQFLDITFDHVFKLVFGTEMNKEITLGLLNDVYGTLLNTYIEDIIFVKQDPDRSSALDKAVYIDVLCKTYAGEKFIVEMQRGSDPDYLKRATIYASRAYSSQMYYARDNNQQQCIDYKDVKQVRFLSISQNVLFPHIDRYFTYGPVVDIHTNEIMSEEITYSYIELAKFNKKYEDCKTHIDLWTYIIKNISDIDQCTYNSIMSRHDIFTKTCNALERGSYDEDTLLILDKAILDRTSAYNKMQRERAEAVAEGRIEGEKNAKTEMVKSLLQIKTLTVEQISEVSGLTIDEIKKINRNN